MFIYHQIIIPHPILLPRRNFKHYSVKDPGFLPEGTTNPIFFVKFSKKNPMNCEKGWPIAQGQSGAPWDPPKKLII